MDKTTQKSEGDSMTQYKGKDNWKNMISYEIDKMNKDSYGRLRVAAAVAINRDAVKLSLIHISEPTRRRGI